MAQDVQRMDMIVSLRGGGILACNHPKCRGDCMAIGLAANAKAALLNRCIHRHASRWLLCILGSKLHWFDALVSRMPAITVY